jgi:hypothetical protein
MSTIKNYLWFVFNRQKPYFKLKEEKEKKNKFEQDNFKEIQFLQNISLDSIERLAPYI